MKKERILLYAVIFTVAVHVLVTTKIGLVVKTGRRVLKDGGLKKAVMGKVKAKVKHTSPPVNTKKIVWFDDHNSGHGLRNKARKVQFKSCEFKSCALLPPHIVNVTSSNSNDSIEAKPIVADAVIFQGAHLARFDFPKRRDVSQVFVFAERESWMFLGMDTDFEKHKYANVFNWTMTYRRDSDIPLPYGEIRMSPDQKKNKNYKKIFNTKKRGVVWLVSNCFSKSLREDYVKDLKKYIHVDVIGACGNQTCPKKNNRECKADIVAKYKFILAFENTFHKDYVTEKLFDWYNRDIISVVYGLADYSKVAPKGTIIDSSKFESPKALGQFLIALGADRHRYINFLKRKDGYTAIGNDPMQQRAYCKLCKLLHTVDNHRQVYPHIGTWWKLNSTQGVNPYVREDVVRVGELIRKSNNSTDKFLKMIKEKSLI